MILGDILEIIDEDEEYFYLGIKEESLLELLNRTFRFEKE